MNLPSPTQYEHKLLWITNELWWEYGILFYGDSI